MHEVDQGEDTALPDSTATQAASQTESNETDCAAKVLAFVKKLERDGDGVCDIVRMLAEEDRARAEQHPAGSIANEPSWPPTLESDLIAVADQMLVFPEELGGETPLGYALASSTLLDTAGADDSVVFRQVSDL